MTKRVVWSDAVRRKLEAGPSRFISRASIEAHSAHTFGEFMERVDRDRADLVVLDLDSQELPAAAICERLRADPRTAAIPILLLAPPGADTEQLRRLGCNEVIPSGVETRSLQEKIAGALGLRLRRHERFEVVLPVARGRIFHEFLGYTNSLSEAGLGFDTIARIRGGDQLNLKIYRSTDEKPISVTGRVCGVRPNIDTGVGYAVGVEFMRLAASEKQRLVDLFPGDPCVTWGGEPPAGESPAESAARADA